VCLPDGTAGISITFGNRPDLDGQAGELTIIAGPSETTVANELLTFQSNQTVTIPYPPVPAGTTSVLLRYDLAGESESRTIGPPPTDCMPATTTTTAAPGTTTTTAAGTTTTTAALTTTTTLPGTTTTTAATVGGLQIGSAASVCSKDVPFVDITFGNQPEFNGIVGTITFETLDGTFVESHPVTYQANETVRLVYPGASFDPVTGEATDWPGWMLNADGSGADPSDQAFRDGLIIVASLPSRRLHATLGRSRPIFQQAAGETVTATTTITYPPETAACNSPAVRSRPTHVTGNAVRQPAADRWHPVAALDSGLGVTLAVRGSSSRPC
jgi:hypothetical protein